MALVDSPFNLGQIAGELVATYPDRTVPDGWGLSARGNDVFDSFGIFTDEEIGTVAGGLVYDEQYGWDPDLVYLTNQAFGDLDIIRQSNDPNVAQLASIIRCMMRYHVRNHETPPTF